MNNRSHTDPEKISAINDIQNPIVIKVAARINNPTVVKPAVYKLI